MEFLAAILAWAFGLISSFASYQGLQSPLNYFFPQNLNITADLGPQLSPGASIFLPGSSQFESATTRWQQHYRSPSFRAAVQVATERDVQQTVSRTCFLDLKSDTLRRRYYMPISVAFRFLPSAAAMEPLTLWGP